MKITKTELFAEIIIDKIVHHRLDVRKDDVKRIGLFGSFLKSRKKLTLS